MRNTSEGYHTFAFFQRAKDEEYSLLENDFIGYMKDTGELKRCPVKDKKILKVSWAGSLPIRQIKGFVGCFYQM